MTAEAARERAYPVPPLNGDGDPRFTYGLLDEVAGVIEAHGYPKIMNGPDLMELHVGLFRFLYGEGAA